MSEVRMFPIQDGPSVPWSIFENKEERCRINHGQTLKRIAERGGLSCAEAFAIIADMNLPQLREFGFENAKQKWLEYTEAMQLKHISVKGEVHI